MTDKGKVPLLPCPFCGAEAVQYNKDTNADFIGCSSCKAFHEGTAEDWNRRAIVVPAVSHAPECMVCAADGRPPSDLDLQYVCEQCGHRESADVRKAFCDRREAPLHLRDDAGRAREDGSNG